MRKGFVSLCGLILIIPSLFAQNNSIETDVESLLSKMTLEEKIGQMNQYAGFFDPTGPAPQEGDAANKYHQIESGLVGSMLNVRGVEQVQAMQKLAVEKSRLGIPLIFGFDVIHGYRTISPIPLAEAASWDLAAIKQSARVAAIESAASGLNWTFAPNVDISRDPRWGRVMEGAGEDPYLGSQIAQARVTGFQGEDLAATNTIAACTKHFAAYGFAEAGRDYNTVDIGLSTLYNVVLPPFKATVDAGVKTFMNSFNELNGIPATGDAFLQRDILKGAWHFPGFVVSDWGSIREIVNHSFAADGVHASQIAANAGSDMDMESHLYVKHLKKLVQSGKVPMQNIDDAVRRILTVKYELGLFEDPYRYCDEAREKEMISHPDHIASVLDMAKKSIVLLKNDNNLLPLPKSGKKIALIGPLAADKDSPLGNWRGGGEANSAISVMEGMQAYTGNTLSHEQGVKLIEGDAMFHAELQINNTDASGIKEAVRAAKRADIVVMVLGEHGLQSGEGRSQADVGLPGLQQQLLEKVYAANPNIVLVLNNGRPLIIPWASANIPAIVEGWQLGSQSGHAIAQVLYGDYNPSGKLPMTFPKHLGQVPIYYNHKTTGRPGPSGAVFWSHYTDLDNAPMYPFGFGLSYTSFAYSDLAVSVDAVNRQVQVSVQVKNTGSVLGEEVVQLYLRDRVASITRPIKELKAFDKILLAPGESKKVSFELGESSLGFYNNQGRFVIENGTFDVMVGGNSAETINQSFEF
ncbi:MAG: beta-glucosidase BglX [Bacteroidota bacterium]